MLKEVILLLLMMANLISVSAQQNFALEEFSDRLGGNFSKIIIEEAGYSYVISAEKKEYYLYKIDVNTMEAEDIWTIDKEKVKGERPGFATATVSNEGFHIVLMRRVKNGNGFSFEQKLIDRNGKLLESKEVAYLENVSYYQEISFLSSEDHTKEAIVWMPEKGSLPKVFVFDNKMELLWETTLRNPFEEKFEVGQMELSNNGDLWFVGYKNSGRHRWYEVKPSDAYAVAKVKKEDMFVYELEDKQKIFYNLNIKPDLKSGLIVLTGFYGENDKDYPNGVYYGEIDEADLSPKVERLQIATEINDGSLDQSLDMWRALGGNSTKEGLESFKFKTFVLFENGHVGAVAERDYYDGMPGGYLSHFMDELVVMNFDLKGRISWVEVVPKKQQEVRGNSSYCDFFSEDKLFLVFNNDLRNIETIINGSGEMYTTTLGKNAGVIAVQIGEDGAVKLQGLPNDGKNYYTPNKKGVYKGENSLSMPLHRSGRSDFRLLRYTFLQ